MPAINGTMLQAFHWDTPADGSQLNEIGARAAELARAGFTALWLPPPGRSQGGAIDVGYGSCDLFDLGEFDQKGTVRTKYGTRAQLEAAVRAAHQVGLQVYVDAILNHKGGADGTETVMATPVSNDNRNVEIGPAREIDAWTRFDFPGRGSTYSSFQWRAQQFDAVDFDQRTGDRSIFRLADKHFETPVDPERGNFDYLLFDDIDMSRAEARDELVAWGNWMLSVLAVDGFGFDAVKHIWFLFFVEWWIACAAQPADRCSPWASTLPAASPRCAGSSSRPASACRSTTSRCISICATSGEGAVTSTCGTSSTARWSRRTRCSPSPSSITTIPGIGCSP